MRPKSMTVLLAVSALIVSACRDTTPSLRTTSARDAASDPYAEAMLVKLERRAPTTPRGLKNVYRLSDNIISGSEPDGEDAFESLARMGVKTILSVDGKAPDAAAARRHGLRYVHIPIEYSGIDDEDFQHIVKTFRELEAPFYVHCFHGRHRGPAAAAIGRLVRDGATRGRALAEMRQWCGTSEKYHGLYEVVAHHSIPPASTTRALQWTFPASRTPDGLRQAMVGISRRWDNLKTLSRTDFVPPSEHPDLDAGHEARLLAQALGEALRTAAAESRPTDFTQSMKHAADAARLFADRLADRQPNSVDDAKAIRAAMRAVKAQCAACHRRYRNG